MAAGLKNGQGLACRPTAAGGGSRLGQAAIAAGRGWR